MAENVFRAFQTAKLVIKTRNSTLLVAFFFKNKLNTVKPVLSGHFKTDYRLEHSAIILTFIKLPFVIKIGFWSIFKLAVTENPIFAASSCTQMRILRTRGYSPGHELIHEQSDQSERGVQSRDISSGSVLFNRIKPILGTEKV